MLHGLLLFCLTMLSTLGRIFKKRHGGMERRRIERGNMGLVAKISIFMFFAFFRKPRDHRKAARKLNVIV